MPFHKNDKRRIAQGIRRERERISKLQNLEERERVAKLKAPPQRETSAEKYLACINSGPLEMKKLTCSLNSA